MKILKLTFENINSLTGKSEIDFTRSPLSDAGIFLICGPTGAGKTTILDAICVALYEKTPRLEGSAVRNLMSQQKGYCVSEVDFSVKDKVYRAKWELRKAYNKPDGNFQDSTRELSELSGDDFVIIENKKKDINDTIESVTGLNFNRFTRSVLLPQGNFAAFLEAKEDERADLLEKMTGTTIYSKISQKVFEIHKEERNKLDDLKRALDGILPASQEELETLNIRKKELTENIKTSKNRVDALTEKSESLKRIDGLNKEILKAEENLKNAEEVKEKSTAKFLTLERALKANVFRPDLEKLDLFKNSSEVKRLRCEELKKDIPKIEDEFKKVSKEIGNERAGFESFKKIKQEKESAIEKAVVKESEIKGFETNLSEILNKIKAHEKSLNELSRNKALCESELTKLSETKSSLEKFITGNQIYNQLESYIFMLSGNVIDIENYRSQFEKTDTELKALNLKLEKIKTEIWKKETELDKAKKKLNLSNGELEKVEKKIAENDGINESRMEADLEKLKASLDNIGKIIETDIEIKEVSEKIEENEKALLKNNSEFESLKEDERKADLKIEEYEERKELLEEKYKNELLISKYEDVRSLLKDNEPCPLCGSKDHPVGNIEYKEGKTQKEISENKDFLTKSLKAKDRIRDGLFKLISEKDGFIKETVSLKKALEEKKAFRNDAFEKTGLKENESPASVFEGSKAQKESIEVKLKNLKNLRKKQYSLNETIKESLKILEKEKDTLSELKSEMKSSETVKNSLIKESVNQKIRIEKIEGEIIGIASKFKVKYVKGEEKILNRVLEEKDRVYKKKSEELKSVDKAAVDLKEKEADINSREKSLREGINETFIEKGKLEEKLESLKKERKEILDGKIEDERKSIRDKETLYLSNIEKLDREKNALESDLAVKNENLKNIVLELKGVDEDIEKLNLRLLKDISAKGFESIEKLKSDLLNEEEVEKLSKEKKDIEERVLTETTRVKDLKEQLERLKVKIQTDSSLEDITKEFEEASKNLENQKKELWEIERTLREDSELRKKKSEQIEKLVSLRKEYSKWSMLNELIGSADGKKFRKFAQGLTLEHLINLSNLHLSKLNKRYQMRRKVDEDLGIDIIDTYKADLSRPVKTLSGGESFLVSLSLALGLSSLVSRDVRIDSLFLDEGFGSLDKDSMDLALDALDNLNATGKTIGIISHIDSVKERIPVQIVVKTAAHGESTISI